MNELISIIIPMYNAQNTIKDTLENICKQTYHNLQIIVVDNLSTDHSVDIVNNYMTIDNRIDLYFAEKKGPSAARNVGLDHVKGDMIFFCDADDKMHENMILYMYENLLKHNASCSFCKFTSDFRSQEIVFANDSLIQLNTEKAIFECLTNDDIGGYLWNKCFLTKIITENHIRFDEDIFHCEDLLFVIKYLLCVNKIIVTEKALYYYNHTENSLSNQQFSWWQITNLHARLMITEMLKNASYISLYKTSKHLLYMMMSGAGRLMETCYVSDNEKDSYNSYRDLIISFCRNNIFSFLLDLKLPFRNRVILLKYAIGLFKKK